MKGDVKMRSEAERRADATGHIGQALEAVDAARLNLLRPQGAPSLTASEARLTSISVRLLNATEANLSAVRDVLRG